MRKERGFTEFEFLGLVAVGLLIAGLLAHFFFDLSIQVERLNALVARDAVRLSFESRLNDLEVIRKSVNRLGDSKDEKAFKACLLGASPEFARSCTIKSGCCISRQKIALPFYELGDTDRIFSGTEEVPSCLDHEGNAVANSDCFAEGRVVAEAVCADGRETCKVATALIFRYQLEFSKPFLTDDIELMTLDRSISVVVGP